MQRRILATIAVLSLLAAVTLTLWFPTTDATLAFCWRLGALAAAAWLAYDDVQRLPGWILIALPVLVIVLVRWPRLLWPLIPLLIVLAVLRRVLASSR
jgi:hypothetical protein